jgi:hypothetical protein
MKIHVKKLHEGSKNDILRQQVKVILIHAMNAYWGSTGQYTFTTPWDKMDISGDFHSPAALTEARWAPEAVLMFLGREKFLAAARIRTPNHPARSLIAIPTALPWP